MTGRGRRRILWGLLVLGGLIVSVLLAGPLLLDREQYRDVLTRRASQLLHRNVTARSLRVHLLPWPGVTIRGLRIADRAPWSEPFVDAEQLHVALKLLPLLRGELQVRHIRIDRPRVRLAMGADEWNIEDLIRPAAYGAVVEPRRTVGTRVSKGQSPLPVLLAGALAVRHGTIIVLERPLHPYGPADLELQEVNLDITAPLSPHQIRVHLSGHLPNELSGAFDLIGSVQRATGDRPSIAVELRVRGLEATQLVSLLGPSHAPSSSAAFSGTLDLTGKADGEWPVLDLQADADLQRVGVTLAKNAHKMPGEQAWLRAKGRWEADQLDLPEVRLHWKGQTATGRLHFATRQSPRLQFWLHTPELALDPLAVIATAAGSGAARSPTPPASVPLPSSSSLRAGGKSRKQDARLQVKGHLRADVLRAGTLILTTAEGTLRYCCGRLTIHQLRGDFYGGHLTGEAALSFMGRSPHARITTHLQGVQTEPLLEAIQTPQWTVRGMMMLDSTLELSGPLGPGALARTSGHTDMAVTNGRIIGYAPLERFSTTVTPLLQQIGIASPTLHEFDRLSARWTLDNGIVRTRDLMLRRGGATLSAVGSINLRNQALDFDVTAKVARATFEAKVQGTPSDPVITPYMGRLEGGITTDVGTLMGSDRNKTLDKILRELLRR